MSLKFPVNNLHSLSLFIRLFSATAKGTSSNGHVAVR